MQFCGPRYNARVPRLHAPPEIDWRDSCHLPLLAPTRARDYGDGFAGISGGAKWVLQDALFAIWRCRCDADPVINRLGRVVPRRADEKPALCPERRKGRWLGRRAHARSLTV